MTRDELLTTLNECAVGDDLEVAHQKADEALLEFINDPEITAAFESWEKWYA